MHHEYSTNCNKLYGQPEVTGHIQPGATMKLTKDPIVGGFQAPQARLHGEDRGSVLYGVRLGEPRCDALCSMQGGGASTCALLP